MAQGTRPCRWRSASLEVGGKGRIIANFGFRIAKLEVRRQKEEVRYQRSVKDFNDFNNLKNQATISHRPTQTNTDMKRVS
jgi:hypothetical protein